MNEYHGDERRRISTDSIGLLVEACDRHREVTSKGIKELTTLCSNIDTKVAIQNGRVATNENSIKSLFGKIRIIQDEGLEERGIRRGKRIMLTNGRLGALFLIAIVGVGIAIYTLGVGEIRRSELAQNKELEVQLKKSNKKIEDISDYFIKHKDVIINAIKESEEMIIRGNIEERIESLKDKR